MSVESGIYRTKEHRRTPGPSCESSTYHINKKYRFSIWIDIPPGTSFYSTDGEKTGAKYVEPLPFSRGRINFRVDTM